MTDPERLSQRHTGLAAELLRAAADEQPSDHGLQRTLLALGVSGAILSSTSAAGAALASAQVTSATSASAAASGGVGLSTAGAVSSISATLVVKWVGLGVLGGLGLAGVADVTTLPPPRAVASHVHKAADRVAHPTTTPARPAPRALAVSSAAPEIAVSAAPAAPRAAVIEPRVPVPIAEVGAPLAAEVSYIDRARSLVAAGQSSQGLALLESYEQHFREARLLPEVLFLQLEAYERAGRHADARRAAQRLVASFPTSPHAGRARKLLGE
jgi:hypothetical protein